LTDVPGNGNDWDPKGGNEDETNGHDEGPIRPGRRNGLGRVLVPPSVGTPFEGNLDPTGREDEDHGDWGNVPPAEHPIEMWPPPSHELNVLCKPTQPVNVRHPDALKEGNDEERHIPTKRVKQKENVIPSSMGKHH